MTARVIFKNAAVFDGRTPHLLENHAVVVEDGRIVELRAGDASVAGDDVVDVGGRTLMPGMIDLHTHPCMTDVVGIVAVNQPTELVALSAARDLKRSLMSGFTTLRDAGGTEGVYVQAIESGLIEGPRLYHAGRFITMTGGHGDMRDPLRPGHDMSCCGAVHERFLSIADGADEVRKAVREELRRGAKQVKLFLSGGVMSPGGSVDHLQYTEAEIRAAVEEAEAQGKYVMAHCHPDGAVRRAVELGVRSIEHCSFITEDTARLIVERGAYVVPTLAVGKALSEDGASIGIGPVYLKKMEGLFDKVLQSVEMLNRLGAKMGFGSDVCGQFADRQCTEFVLRAAIMSAYDILVSATSMAAEIMREDGRLGVIAPGAFADMLVVDGNPLDDVRIFADAGRSLSVIMKGGHFHKRRI